MALQQVCLHKPNDDQVASWLSLRFFLHVIALDGVAGATPSRFTNATFQAPQLSS